MGIELRGLHSYNLGSKVGSGTFCDVYKGTDRKTNEVVALKKIKLEQRTPEQRDQGFPVTVRL